MVGTIEGIFLVLKGCCRLMLSVSLCLKTFTGVLEC